jgi:hypothetical protein
MRNGSTIKAMLPNWWLSILLCTFIFALITPTFSGQVRVPVKTEQRETVRSIRIPIISFKKLCHSTNHLEIFENGFLYSLLSCSNYTQIKIRDQSKEFKPYTFCWERKISPRLNLDIPLA